MTLNQVITRIKNIATAHRQVRSFGVGQLSNFLTDHTTKYPAVFLQDAGGTISISRKATTLNYRMFFMDLVHVSEDAKDNEQDVISDMVSVAMDIVAQMNTSIYSDWKLSTDNSLQFVAENEGDMTAGCVLDFSVSFMFSQNICQVPSEYIYSDGEQLVITDFMIYKYTATGDEGRTFTVASLKGKKVLLIFRGERKYRVVTVTPADTEEIQFVKSIGSFYLIEGDELAAGEKIDILYTA